MPFIDGEAAKVDDDKAEKELDQEDMQAISIEVTFKVVNGSWD